MVVERSKLQKTRFTSKARGFTLIELVLVMTLVAAIVGISTPFLISYQRRNMLRTDTIMVQELIRRAQGLAENSVANSNWGVYFNGQNVIIYKGDNYLGRDPAFDETSTLSDATSVSGNLEYNFDVLTGDTVNAGSTILTVDNNSKEIFVNEKGLITQ